MLKNVKNASFGAFLWEKICIFQIKAVFLRTFYENYRRYFNTTESATLVYSGSVSVADKDGQPLMPFINRPSAASFSSGAVAQSIIYNPDAHYGSLAEPIQLIPLDVDKAVKQMINGVLYILRDGKIYNAQGAIVNNPEK